MENEMKLSGRKERSFVWRSGGFTINEVLIVIIILTILLAFSMPDLIEWRSRLTYREITRNVVSALRVARSLALATNREHRVEFEETAGRYRITRGNRASDSNSWNQIVQDWIVFPPEVHMGTTVSSIQFNTNGTANGGTIRIQDATYTTEYEVKVVRTGRIRIP